MGAFDGHRRPRGRHDDAFVTAVLRNVGRGVTRLSLSCNAEPLEYVHHANKKAEERKLGTLATLGPVAEGERTPRKRSPSTPQEVPWRVHWRIQYKSGADSSSTARPVAALGSAIIAASKLVATTLRPGELATSPSGLQ